MKSPLKRAKEGRPTALCGRGASALPAPWRQCAAKMMNRKNAQELQNSAPAKARNSREGAKAKSAVKATRVLKGSTDSPTPKSPHDFSPTLGELHLHLFGEGRYAHIYEKRGAHASTHDG